MPKKLQRIKNVKEVFDMDNDTLWKIDRQYRKWAKEKLQDMLEFTAERTVIMNEVAARQAGFNPAGAQILYLNEILSFVTAFLVRAQDHYLTAVTKMLQSRPEPHEPETIGG